MASSLDMALDDLIKLNKKKKPTTTPADRRRVTGPIRRFAAHNQSTSNDRRSYHYSSSAPRRPNDKAMEESKWKHDMFYVEDDMADGSRVYGRDWREDNLVVETKVLISNLDSGVSDADIKELFSDIGEIKRYSIHCDGSGRSMGTAEVVYGNGQDALQAVKRYNNVQLDGRPMRVMIVSSPAPSVSTRAFQYSSNIQRSFPSRGGGWQGRRGGGRTKHGTHVSAKPVSVSDLDADLDNYYKEAMQV